MWIHTRTMVLVPTDDIQVYAQFDSFSYICSYWRKINFFMRNYKHKSNTLQTHLVYRFDKNVLWKCFFLFSGIYLDTIKLMYPLKIMADSWWYFIPFRRFLSWLFARSKLKCINILRFTRFLFDTTRFKGINREKGRDQTLYLLGDPSGNTFLSTSNFKVDEVLFYLSAVYMENPLLTNIAVCGGHLWQKRVVFINV